MSFAKCTIYLTNIYVVRKEESLPTRERGLKLCSPRHKIPTSQSLPTRERGLKPVPPYIIRKVYYVAPHAGAWIETGCALYIVIAFCGRSPRGSVD